MIIEVVVIIIIVHHDHVKQAQVHMHANEFSGVARLKQPPRQGARRKFKIFISLCALYRTAEGGDGVCNF